jgi:3-oxoacyl-[acyl-carrier protein] reductase
MSLSITDRMNDAARGALEGRVAIVTGAGRGIGRAIAVGFAKAGAAVCCISRSAGEVAETADIIASNGGNAISVATDVRDLPGVEAAADKTVELFGGLDILVANHGVQTVEASGAMEETDPVKWRETIEINLIGTYHCCRAVVPHLKARGSGKIIAVGSGQGHRGSAGNAGYASSKAGLWMMVQVLAQELAPFNISVNELLPGHVATRIYKEMTAKLQGTNHADLKKPKDLRPLEWCKEPEDVVPLALFLACQPDLGPSAQSYSLMRRF